MDLAKLKKYSKRIWRFLIHEDSWASFAADAVLIVLLGYFIIFPVFGLFMGTSLPAVAVVSSSMDHQNLEFDDWWLQNSDWYSERGFEKEQFEQFYLNNGFKKGDIIIMKGIPFDEIQVGDVVVYDSPAGVDIIHRVVWMGETRDGGMELENRIGTKGDANSGQLYFERQLTEESIKGKAIAKIPKLGWIKVIFVDVINALK